MATSPSPNPPPSAIPQFTTTAPPPHVFYLPAPLPYSPELNANSPAAAPAKSPQNPLSTNSTANTPVSPPEHPITSTPPQLSIISPPPEFSITSPPPPQLADVPTLPEISPPPLSANPLPSSATPPKPTLPTTSPLPPSTPLVASPPPLSPASPKSSPIPTVRRPSAVSPRSTPTPTVTPPSPVSSKSTPPSPKPPATRPPKPSKASTNSPPAPSPPPERSSPPTPVKKPHPASPDTRISSNISLKVSPPPSPFFSLRVSPPPSVNLTTNNPSSFKSTENAGIGTGGTVAIVLVLGLVLISLIGITICCMRKRRRKFSGMNDDHIILTSLSFSPKSDSALLKMQTFGTRSGSNMGSDTVYSPPTESGGLGNSRSWFSYEELADATKGFSMQNLLGEGGFGFVYKGYLGDGREIAVKQLNVGGGQGEREFKAEVEIISRVHHRHLVSLVGYCVSQNQRLLVYDYVANNNLYFHLHEESRPVMEWTKRVKVAAGAARGIAYLHEDCHPRIIHRDIKSSNILLDNSFEARVSDFGLAKLVLNANSHVTTRVIGTFGYMAPEYASSGLLTEKSDVYSFGVVLLELITGRKPVDASQPAGDESLVEWARPLLTVALDNGNIKALADPGLGNNYVECEMFKIVEVAAACVRHAAAKRPRMGQVVREFDSMAASDITNGMRVGESELFNSLQSAEIRFFSRVQIASQDCSKKIF